MRHHPKLSRKRSNNNASGVESHQSGPSHKRKRNSHNNAAPATANDGSGSAGITQMQLKLFSDGKRADTRQRNGRMSVANLNVRSVLDVREADADL